MLRVRNLGGLAELTMRSTFFALSVLAATSISSACLGAPVPTPIQFWKRGDDGLTNRLADAIFSTLERSANFTMSTGQPGTLYVSIVQNVAWENVGSVSV